MGIFDDAIRQHIDLKRKLGADDDELKELEDEAFGLPTRPGEPDFPGEEAAAPDDAPEQGAAAADGEAEEPEAPADEPAAPEPEPDSPAPERELEPEPESMPETAEPELEPAPEPESAEPEPEPEPEDAPAFTTAEREAIADQPTVLFDQTGDESLELGDLELDDESDEEEAWDEPSTGEEPLTGDEPSTGEEPLTGEEEAPSAETDGEGVEPEEEDVLEETPEFLRDNPDDDELWFEQGEPKDFDF